MSALPLSYSCGSAEPALLGRTIDEILSESAARFPHGEALVVCHQGVRLTYAEFHSKVLNGCAKCSSSGQLPVTILGNRRN